MQLSIADQRVLLATELPLHQQEILSAFTDYDFVISPICVEFPEYLSFYAQQRKRGRYVILDNGAFEGKLLDEDSLLSIAWDILPQEIVAPDVIGSRSQTFTRAKRFVKRLREQKFPLNRMKVQVCPQGNTFEEWTQSYQELADLPGVSTIGVSYVGHFNVPEDRDYFGDMAAEEVVRLRFFHYLIGNGLLREDKAHHLLGLYSPAALCWYARYPFIRSIDTSFPVVAALHRTALTRSTCKYKDHLDYTTKLELESVKLAVDNIQWMQKELTR